MSQFEFMGMLIASVGALGGGYAIFSKPSKERDKELQTITMQQIQSQHDMIIAMKDLTHEMKLFKNDTDDRIHNLEVVVFKKDRI